MKSIALSIVILLGVITIRYAADAYVTFRGRSHRGVPSSKKFVVNRFQQQQQRRDDSAAGAQESNSAAPLPPGLELELNTTDGSYSVIVYGRRWLFGAPPFVTIRGRRLYPGNGLTLDGHHFVDGTDSIGRWYETVLVYRGAQPPPARDVEMHIAFRRYSHLADVLLFGQRFPRGAVETNNGQRQTVSTGFPHFVHNGSHRPTERLGYLAYGGIMAADTDKRIGIWDVSGIRNIKSGLDSGPLVLFAEGNDDAVVLTPFRNFMATSTEYRVTPDGKEATVSWGLIGTMNYIPEDFDIWTVAVGSRFGINRAMFDWGEFMRLYYRRGTDYRESDLTNNYIGYWTDNGAYYYYITEMGKTFEQTMIDVREYADKHALPYKYIQYDSWWYQKSPVDDGTYKWEADPNSFPHGLQYTWNRHNWTAAAHNRWWSNSTAYARQNGGHYDFIVESGSQKALPIDSRFWKELLATSRKWGLILYEQDWLNDQFDEMNVTVSEPGVGREWLMLMGEGARDNGLTIQYCMAPARAVLQSLEIPVVTQARVSNDYQPGNDQWKIGISSIFAHALGIAPFKDNFWTTTDQPGNKYHLSEPYPELQSVVATLSTGPVAPSDRINYTNVELVWRSCNSDGLILKPFKPATAIDHQIRLKAFEGFNGEIWSTFTEIDGWLFGIIFAADFGFNDKVTIRPEDAGFFPQFGTEHVVFSWFDARRMVVPFSREMPLTLSKCTKSEFCHYLTSPVMIVGDEEFIIYGELSKWVPISYRRISRIVTVHGTPGLNDVEIHLRGGAEEHVVFSVGRRHGPVVHVDCVLTRDGWAKLSVARSLCI